MDEQYISQNFDKLIKDVVENNSPQHLTTRYGNVVMVPETYWKEIQDKLNQLQND